MDEEIEIFAFKNNSLPRFIDRHESTKELFDWISLLKNQYLDLNFNQLSVNKIIKNELKDIYVAFMYQEITNNTLMKNVILWELETQFGTVPIEKNILKQINSEIKAFKISHQEKINREKLLEHYIPFTKTLIDQTTYRFQINIKPEQIFSELNICTRIPLIIYQNNVKVLPNFRYFHYPKNIETDCCYIFYSNVWIKIAENGTCHLQTKHNVRKTLFFKDFIDYIKLSFKDFEYKINESIFQGSFYFPNLLLDKISFFHHILLDPNLNYIVLDERNITRKDWFILKIFLSKKIHINCSQKKVMHNSKILRLFGSDDFSIDSPYFKISFNNVEDISFIETLKLKLAKCLYFVLHNDVRPMYTKYINIQVKLPIVKTIENKHCKSNKQLKQKVPELFVTDYPRKCLHLPRILEEKDDNAIQFPIKNEPGKPRWYSCDHHKKAIFPGLRKNTLQNKHLFPVIPCCYIADQRKKQSSEYRKYYNNEPNGKIQRSNEYIIFTTNRILPKNIFGTLPINLESTFFNCENKTFFRFGVEHSGNSILDCCSHATGVEKPSIDYIKSNYFYYKQELNLQNESLNDNYLNPNILYRLLEEWYDVSIILFENVKEISNITKINKNNLYYSGFEWKSKVICIIKNKGLEADLNEYDQCELVCQDCKEKAIFVFQYEHVKNICKLFDEVNHITRIKKETNVKEQYITSSGFTYKIIKENNSEMFCEPLHPVYLKKIVEKVKTISDVEKYKDLKAEFKKELRKYCLKEENVPNYLKPMIEKLSDKSKKWISEENILYEPKYSTEYLIFKKEKDYSFYINFQNHTRFSDKRVCDGKILYIKEIEVDETIFDNYESFVIFSLSKENKLYFKKFFKEDSQSSTIFINIDHDWYIESDLSSNAIT